MQPRFVIVPAVPVEKERVQTTVRMYARAAFGGFDIYDTLEKYRLKPSYPTRADAESECARRNR
jgi:hypothetical protein